MGLGVPLSNKIFIRERKCFLEALDGKVKNGSDLFGGYLKHFGDLIQRHACLEIYEHSLDGHPSPLENLGATDLAWDALNSGTLRPIEIRHDSCLLLIIFALALFEALLQHGAAGQIGDGRRVVARDDHQLRLGFGERVNRRELRQDFIALLAEHVADVARPASH
jgi:hypothetical protein